MSKHWTMEEESPLIECMPSYRKKIRDKDLQQARKITKHFSKHVRESDKILSSRSENAIYERLPYLDNLLAGVFKREAYANKDRHRYGTSLREDRKPNRCNARHPYNGAMKEYMRDLGKRNR
ncbi:hypothetical protein [Rossellomorea aquimaris]|uniref:hypothetical protein n=1 Tax=Rossellomorea aquimaris TaxID=189382 RepID=UPI001CFCAF9F|nr:hypothetical protein [Rossellomorea aquimaris]